MITKKGVITHEFRAVEIDHKYDFVKRYEIYLPVYYKLSYNNLNRIDKRLYLFGCKSYEEMHDVIDNEEDLKILEELERLGMNERFICEYDREKVNKKLMNSLRNEGIRAGEIRGIREGEIRRNIEVARNLLKEKVDYSVISRSTGLSINEINSLR